MQVNEIRQKILKCQGMGFNKTEIAKSVAEAYGVTKRNIYHHMANQAKWQNDYFTFDDAATLKRTVLTRINHIYREASFQYLQTRSEDYNAKVGFLRVMLEATEKLRSFLPDSVLPQGDVKHIVEVVDPAELLKRYDALIEISREPEKEIN